jgi:hypothetical protein
MQRGFNNPWQQSGGEARHATPPTHLKLKIETEENIPNTNYFSISCHLCFKRDTLSEQH